MLTDLQVRKLRPKPDERYEVWDARLPGFGIRISPSGTKSFILVYRHKSRPRRMTLGRYHVVSLADARDRAIEALGDLARGVDPQARKSRSACRRRRGLRHCERATIRERVQCR